jgi:hypothetical protein
MHMTSFIRERFGKTTDFRNSDQCEDACRGEQAFDGLLRCGVVRPVITEPLDYDQRACAVEPPNLRDTQSHIDPRSINYSGGLIQMGISTCANDVKARMTGLEPATSGVTGDQLPFGKSRSRSTSSQRMIVRPGKARCSSLTPASVT